MVKNIPKTEMNPEFKKELRKQILSKIHSKKENRFSLFFPIFASIAMVVFLWVYSWKNMHTIELDNIPMGRISFVPHIERATPNYFGSSIKTISQNNPTMMEWWRATWMMPSNTKMNTDMMMPAYENIAYTYSYSGTLPKIDSNTLPLYKKNSIAFTNQDTASFIRNLHIDWLNTAAFQNAGITNINISEDREFGYNIWIDFAAWNVNIYQNYTMWPQAKCYNNRCETLAKLTKKDIPSNESLIALTDAFFKQYGINRSTYWIPHIDSAWRTTYARSIEDGTVWFIPEIYTVTYPIILDGKNLYEEFGGYKWLMFTIDLRSMRISGVSWLEKYNLESSEYPIIQDSEILNKMISSGWRRMMWGKSTWSWKIIPISLKDPVIGYIRISWEWKNGISTDFFVPAYIFRVDNKPQDAFISDTVVIPIVDGFTQELSPNIQPMTEPIIK